MAWVMEVRVKDRASISGENPQGLVWRKVRPTGGVPYRYGTQREAMGMLRACYPDQTRDEARVREEGGE